MIERYDSPEISDIWKDQNKFSTYLKVEIALIKAMEGNLIPEGISEAIKGKCKANPERIKEIEQTTKHDVIAFCQSITEDLPNGVSKYFHFGVTSSDIIDTATNLQIKNSVDLILKQYKKLLKALEGKAREYRLCLCMGRSHGMNAEPMSFGQKFLSAYAEFYRHYQALSDYYENDITGQFSGAVGNYTILNTDIEKTALESLGLKPEPVSTQVIPRDRITKLVSINAMIASAIERLAVEIRLLHHSDIGEVNEGFANGQKGSSIMPHKKNPVSGENLCGIARVIRSHLTIAHENNALWHERDISHSSAERMMLPDNLGLTFYAIKRLASTIENLVIHQDKSKKKVLSNFSYLSSYVLHELIKKGTSSREAIYPVIQKASFEAKDAKGFLEIIQKDFSDVELPRIDAMAEEAIEKIYLKEVDKVFERVFDQYPPVV